MLEHHPKSLDLCYFEVKEAFKGLADEHVWARPAPRILSVGELAGHIAYWEAIRFGGVDPSTGSTRDLVSCKISSPLLDPRFGYYKTTVDEQPTEAHLALTAAQVLAELERIHREAMESLKTLNPDIQSKAPQWHASYDDLLRYVEFHIAYHTGQMYTVRHLLGEETPDN